jgi:glyoxylase-like metal-dependent hydrolase (beta-lactamase superfamily II)
MSDAEIYEVFALRYGTMDNRTRNDNFIAHDPHDTHMPIDYFIWVVRNENRTIVVDTGFDHKEAGKRGRVITRLPREALAMLDIDANKVKDVIVTHMHYDHAGTLDDFPAARYHIQEKEMHYVSGRHMCEGVFSHAYTADHVATMIHRLFEGRVQFYTGAGQVAPGIEVHLIGGHTMGVQCVRVLTKRGWVVLASDASHFYENMEGVSPFPIVYNVADMVDGFNTMRRLADSQQHIVPGHDPLVMQRYPIATDASKDVIVRLDVMPTA